MLCSPLTVGKVIPTLAKLGSPLGSLVGETRVQETWRQNFSLSQIHTWQPWALLAGQGLGVFK